MKSRPTKDEYAMGLAFAAAQRGTCTRAKVGCVLMSKRGRVASTGYNGAVRGTPHCIDSGCLMVNGSCARTIHAEINAICNRIADLEDCTAYVTHEPCRTCAFALVNAGVRRIVFAIKRSDDTRQAVEDRPIVEMILPMAGVSLEHAPQLQ